MSGFLTCYFEPRFLRDNLCKTLKCTPYEVYRDENFPTKIVISPLWFAENFKNQSAFKHKKSYSRFFRPCEIKHFSGKKIYPLCTYQMFSNTRTPKIFEIPFLGENEFFENTHTKIFVPSIIHPPLCHSLMRHFYQLTVETRAGRLPFGILISMEKTQFETSKLPLSSI